MPTLIESKSAKTESPVETGQRMVNKCGPEKTKRSKIERFEIILGEFSTNLNEESKRLSQYVVSTRIDFSTTHT